MGLRDLELGDQAVHDGNVGEDFAAALETPGSALPDRTQAGEALERLALQLGAVTGAQTDRMTRDDGWRLLSIGRHVERLGFLAASLDLALDAGALADDAGFEAMLALFDSSISFRAQFQQSREMLALVDLLVLNRDNPRSLAWVAHTLRGRLAKLAGSEPNELSPMSLQVPDPAQWDLAQLCTPVPATGDGAQDADAPLAWPQLVQVLAHCGAAAHAVSELISATYFTHSGASEQSVGA